MPSSSSDSSLMPISREYVSKILSELSRLASEGQISISSHTTSDTTRVKRLDYGCVIYRFSDQPRELCLEWWMDDLGGVTSVTPVKTGSGRRPTEEQSGG